jgi:hypothetical protein
MRSRVRAARGSDATRASFESPGNHDETGFRESVTGVQKSVERIL